LDGLEFFLDKSRLWPGEIGAMIKHFVTWGFALWGAWFLYMACISFIAKAPRSGILTFTTALIGFAASYFSWRQRWGVVLLLFLLFYTIGDLSAVFLAAGR
jgi:hypothetical protein